MDQRNAAVHLSHMRTAREELDEDVHVPGGNQPCTQEVTLAWCEGLPQVVATLRNAKVPAEWIMCAMHHEQAASYLYSKTSVGHI